MKKKISEELPGWEVTELRCTGDVTRGMITKEGQYWFFMSSDEDHIISKLKEKINEEV